MISAELAIKISVVSFIFGGLFLLFTMYFFFRVNVIAIIGSLSGSKAKKEIQAFREYTNSKKSKHINPFMINEDNIVVKRMPDTINDDIVSDDQTDILFSETEVLDNGEETVILDPELIADDLHGEEDKSGFKITKNVMSKNSNNTKN